MATEKNLYGRIAQKIDTAANWEKAINFIPKKGEIIVYAKDENCSHDRIKIGDGTAIVKQLPFIDESKASKEYVDSKFPLEFDSIILKSPNKKFRLTISDEGTFSATEIVEEEV